MNLFKCLERSFTLHIVIWPTVDINVLNSAALKENFTNPNLQWGEILPQQSTLFTLQLYIIPIKIQGQRWLLLKESVVVDCAKTWLSYCHNSTLKLHWKHLCLQQLQENTTKTQQRNKERFQAGEKGDWCIIQGTNMPSKIPCTGPLIHMQSVTHTRTQRTFTRTTTHTKHRIL